MKLKKMIRKGETMKNENVERKLPVSAVKVPYKFETIDFNEWLLFSRTIQYKILHTGFSVVGNKLYVKNLKYNGKTYAFADTMSFYVGNEFCHLPILIEENEVIKFYDFLVDTRKYYELIMKIYKVAMENQYCNCKDEAYKLIIEFLNSILSDPYVSNESVHYGNKAFNPWNYRTENIPSEITSFIDKLKDGCEKKEYKTGDLVKLTNANTNEKHFGIFDPIISKGGYDIGQFACELVEEEDEFCYKYFLPWNTRYWKPKWVFSKADVSELNDTQKAIYENMIKKYKVG